MAGKRHQGKAEKKSVKKDATASSRRKKKPKRPAVEASPQIATPQTATPQIATPQTATPQTATPQTATPASARADEPTIVDFWFDPACPWAWLTSRWMLEVAQRRHVKLVFHVMSLSLLNEHRDVADSYRQMLNNSWAAVRVALGVERDYGQEQLAAFYTAIGTRYHPQGEPRTRDTIEKALSDVGLPPDLVRLGDTGDWDDDLRASHHRGMDPVGYEVGTPVIHVGDIAWFGPVVTPRPTGEDAARLFDAVLTLARFPGFYELKRTRTQGPIF